MDIDSFAGTSIPFSLTNNQFAFLLCKLKFQGESKTCTKLI